MSTKKKLEKISRMLLLESLQAISAASLVLYGRPTEHKASNASNRN